MSKLIVILSIALLSSTTTTAALITSPPSLTKTPVEISVDIGVFELSPNRPTLPFDDDNDEENKSCRAPVPVSEYEEAMENAFSLLGASWAKMTGVDRHLSNQH